MHIVQPQPETKGRSGRVTDQRAEMRTMRAEGLTYREIGERLGLSEDTVRYRVKNDPHGPPGVKPKIPREDVPGIVDSLNNGATPAEIAASYGIHPHNVQRYLKKYGVTRKYVVESVS